MSSLPFISVFERARYSTVLMTGNIVADAAISAALSVVLAVALVCTSCAVDANAIENDINANASMPIELLQQDRTILDTRAHGNSMTRMPVVRKSDLTQYQVGGQPLTDVGTEHLMSFPYCSSARVAVTNGNGEIMFGKNVDESCKIASITKTMTALVASRFPMDKQIVVSEHAASIPGSFAGIVVGDVTDLYEMIDGLMLPSGNDAAYAIAENLGRDMLIADGRGGEAENLDACARRFVEEMNAQAHELGMDNTVFENPCGLDDEGFEGEHVSTARDVAIMMHAAASTYPVNEIMGKREDTLRCERGGEIWELPLTNTNGILDMSEHALGGKTGFTDLAGRCVATAFEKDGEEYCIVVLGADSSQTSFDESVRLLEWVTNTKESRTVELPTLGSTNREQIIGVGNGNRSNNEKYIPVGTLPSRAWKGTKSFGIGIRSDDSEMLSYEANYWEDMWSVRYIVDETTGSGDVQEGDEVGRAVVIDGEGGAQQEIELVAIEGVASPNIFEWAEMALGAGASAVIPH